MFLSVEWAKRWLPALFLLLSLFLPWWTRIDLYAYSKFMKETYYFRPFESFTLSFPWAEELEFLSSDGGMGAWYGLEFFNVPFLFLVSALIPLGGLCGLSNQRRTRTLGGLLGIGGVVLYFVWSLVFPPYIRGGEFRDFYFGIGEYRAGFSGRYPTVGAVWFISVGFYLAIIGSLLLLALSIRTPTETPKEPVFSVIEGLRESIFLSIAWIKRRLPAMFLLLSLLLPWWTMINVWDSGHSLYLHLSFPWNPDVRFIVNRFGLNGSLGAKFYDIPSFFFVSALISVGGLCGFSYKRKIRSLGGLLAVLGVVSFFVLVFHKNFPYFGVDRTIIWFLSFGFYLALAGSLMLLLPLIRALIERLRKRL